MIEQKNVLVIGASASLFSALQEVFLNKHYTVYWVSRQVISDVDSRVRVLSYEEPQDLLDTIVSLKAEFKASSQFFSGIIYANSLGGLRPLKMLKESYLEQMMHVNYVSFVESIRVLLKARLIKEGSSVVAISSISSIKGLKLKLPYAASKAALNAAVMNMASELLPKKIRVNAILKGALTTDVEMDHVRDIVQIGSDDSFSSELGLTTPVEVAETCEFLISNRVSTMTGGLIKLDGGYSL